VRPADERPVKLWSSITLLDPGVRDPATNGGAMATKADFTDEEWSTLQKGVTGTGMLVSLSDPGFTDSFGEVSKLAKYLAAQHETGATDFIRELANIHGTGFGFTSSQEKVETETLAALQAGIATLAAKAPDESANYRQLVLGVAEAVAEAKGGVKDDETAAIAKVTEALGPE
jgi:hypothetical protein